MRNNAVHISGYVNAVERFSKTLPAVMSGGTSDAPFVEKIAAGTFTRAIEDNPDVQWKFNHDRVIGSVKGGEIRLKEDNIGLYAEGETNDPEVVRAAQEGRLTGWSFGFGEPQEVWDNGKSPHERTLKGFKLSEVSILTLSPAYIGTSAEVRAMGLSDKADGTQVNVRYSEDVPEKRASLPDYTKEIEALRLKHTDFC